jgi:beta-galactosidase
MKTLLHGGDYNPEQWLRYPGIIDEDFRLFRLAHINSITIGIFSWAALEPEEGRFEFGWMDDIFERAARQEMRVILATPSGGKPNWLACAHPEIRRVTPEGRREPQQGRHNHCLTSPVYREKVHAINSRLAERYGKNPSVALWHISNEYSGYCYCDLCLAAFQNWLRAKYGSLDALNEAYWTRFWSHTYTAWEQINQIDGTVQGLALDWRRFMTHQCRTFIRNEAEPLRRFSPQVPVTTNMMIFAKDYNYWELAKEIDVASWDSYPQWHTVTTTPLIHEMNPPLAHAFLHNLFRSLKGGKPFLLMETTPSQVNWSEHSPLRRPGVHRLSALQAVAHGSDSVCYFQLRKSRGSCEQFHGAVIDHLGHEQTRVFCEVSALGATLEEISGVAGGTVPARVAIIFDWEALWAYESSATPQNENRRYVDTVVAHYRPFWERSVAVDVIDAETSLDGYDLVVAPLLYLLTEAQGRRLTQFVERGGVLVSTYGTGLVNETTLATLGGVPGSLRPVLGIWVEEFDALGDAFRRRIKPISEGGAGLTGSYEARHYLDLIHAEGAEVLAVYDEDFYAGRPALTRHRFGKGRAYYVASRNDERFFDDFFGSLIGEMELLRAGGAGLPKGVTAHLRVQGDRRYLFLLNFHSQSATVELDPGPYLDAETKEKITGKLSLEPYGSRVLIVG